jgi:hypothetical protein
LQTVDHEENWMQVLVNSDKQARGKIDVQLDFESDPHVLLLILHLNLAVLN